MSSISGESCPVEAPSSEGRRQPKQDGSALSELMSLNLSYYSNYEKEINKILFHQNLIIVDLFSAAVMLAEALYIRSLPLIKFLSYWQQCVQPVFQQHLLKYVTLLAKFMSKASSRQSGVR